MCLLFDYIRRAMPYTAPQSLSDNEVYALVAYILYLNETEHLENVVPTAAVAVPAVGEQAYKIACALCHAAGVANAPREDDSADWQRRLRAAGSEDALFAAAITGKGAMPPRGGRQAE